MSDDERTWRIGDVATATGLTVRALHHYDRIGLVAPSARTPAGHRLYTDADLLTLYQVTALRQLGLSLSQVGEVLSAHVDIRHIIDRQLEHVDRRIRTAQRLRGQLIAARDAADAPGLVATIRLTQDLSDHLTADQVHAIRHRMSSLGVIADHATTVEMPRLYGEAITEMRAGTPPTDPTVRRIVDRLDELAELIRGPDTGIGATVRSAWIEHGRRQPTVHDGAAWGDLVAYLDTARAAR